MPKHTGPSRPTRPASPSSAITRISRTLGSLSSSATRWSMPALISFIPVLLGSLMPLLRQMVVQRQVSEPLPLGFVDCPPLPVGGGLGRRAVLALLQAEVDQHVWV